MVYLERTEGVSSTEIRAEKRALRLGLVGESPILSKIEHESGFVNGMEISGVYTINDCCLPDKLKQLSKSTPSFDALLEKSDALYIISEPRLHYDQIKQALLQGKHILCESPIAMRVEQWQELTDIASQQGLVLMDSIKTAYSLAYYRLRLLAKSGIIGDIYSVDATCTSLFNFDAYKQSDKQLSEWNSICAWGPTALLPIYQLLGTDYCSKTITTHLVDDKSDFDLFTKISFIYPHAVASMKVGRGVKSEGELVISGTKGYIYVPAPWWKTDYFEVRYEDPANNKRYFYQLDGEGLRFELVSFLRSIQTGRPVNYVSSAVSEAIAATIADFDKRIDTILI